MGAKDELAKACVELDRIRNAPRSVNRPKRSKYKKNLSVLLWVNLMGVIGGLWCSYDNLDKYRIPKRLTIRIISLPGAAISTLLEWSGKLNLDYSLTSASGWNQQLGR